MEPYHGAIYFVPEAGEEYAEVGLDDWMSGYFASRSAAMGAVGAEVVIATFFNFDHDLVRRSMDGVWEQASPASVLDARLTAVDRMLATNVLPVADPGDMARAVELVRAAADVACARPEGRPLFAGHASLDWPDDDHLALWHGQTLLREFRGDGHIAALVDAGLNGCEALVTHGAAGEVPAAVLQATRRRSDEDWNAAIESLRSRGWLDAAGCVHRRGTRRSTVDRGLDRPSCGRAVRGDRRSCLYRTARARASVERSARRRVPDPLSLRPLSLRPPAYDPFRVEAFDQTQARQDVVAADRAARRAHGRGGADAVPRRRR